VDVGETDSGGPDFDQRPSRARNGDRPLLHRERLSVQVEASGEMVGMAVTSRFVVVHEQGHGVAVTR
jgi:hypothetical protein